MALTITPININAAGGAATGSVPSRGNAGSLKLSHYTVAVGVAGDYSVGGIPLTAAQVGMDNGVIAGWGAVQVVGGAGTISSLDVIPQGDGTVKVKANALTAESAGAGVAGATLDLYFLGW